MKKKITLYLDDDLVKAIREIINEPPRRSLSYWVEVKIKEELDVRRS